MSNTHVGDVLRDYVIELLEADGQRISREQRINVKKVDIVLIQDDDFVQRRIAIECKNLSHNVSQRETNEVYADYLSLLNQGLIDEIWLISSSDFSPEAKNYAESQRGLHAITLAQFEDNLNGFRRYCRQIREIFAEDRLDKYYLQQKISTGSSLHTTISSWISGNSKKPVAILGGYGMGKTSYCRYLVSTLADAYLLEPRSRVPVYIKLSDIAKQQDIEGLIAKSLASRYRIKNYYFSNFSALNALGRFVLIFDGFDEMKHALSWADFQYNFQQIHTLIRGEAKVLVAGRPNAFLSDDEHSWALRGTRSAGSQLFRIPGAPEYDELEISPFSEPDTKEFISRYLQSRIAPDASGQITPEQAAWIDSRIASFEKVKLGSDLLRPVHTKIFADIASNPSVELKDYNVFELYSLAAAQISEREASKPERRFVDALERQDIVERLAWWLWDTYQGRSLNFSPRSIPRQVLGDKIFKANPDSEDDAVYREVFSGSFLERKFGKNYFFAHRSFLEFFVAKYISYARNHLIPLSAISRNMNPEIMRFMIDGGIVSDILEYCLVSMERYSGEINPILLEKIFDFSQTRDLSSLQISTRSILNYARPLVEVDDAQITYLEKRAEGDLTSKISETRESSLYYLFDIIRRHGAGAKFSALIEKILRVCAMSVNWSHWKLTKNKELSVPKLHFSRSDLREFIFLRQSRITAERTRDGRPILYFDIDRIFADLHEVRAPKIVLSGSLPNPDGGLNFRIPFDDIFQEATTEVRAIAIDVLTSGIAARIGR